MDTREQHGVPTIRTTPPVTPEIEIRSNGIETLLLRILYRFCLAVILPVTAFTELVSLSGRDILFDPFADIFFVVVTSICRHADNFSLLDDYRRGWHDLIERKLSGMFFGGLYELIVQRHIMNSSSFRDEWVFDSHILALFRGDVAILCGK